MKTKSMEERLREYKPNEIFEDKEACKNILAEARGIQTPRWSLLGTIQEDEENSSTSKKYSPLARDEERTLFLAYNYARKKYVDSQNNDKGEGNYWRTTAISIRNRIIEANIGLISLVYARIKPCEIPYEDFISEGNVILIRSADCFNVDTGNKFSTYVCAATFMEANKLFQRRAKKQSREEQVGGNYELLNGCSQANFVEQERKERIRENLQRILSQLSAIEQKVIQARFPQDGTKKTNLRSLTKKIGITPREVKEIERKALQKLRRLYQEA